MPPAHGLETRARAPTTRSRTRSTLSEKGDCDAHTQAMLEWPCYSVACALQEGVSSDTEGQRSDPRAPRAPRNAVCASRGRVQGQRNRDPCAGERAKSAN